MADSENWSFEYIMGLKLLWRSSSILQCHLVCLSSAFFVGVYLQQEPFQVSTILNHTFSKRIYGVPSHKFHEGRQGPVTFPLQHIP